MRTIIVCLLAYSSMLFAAQAPGDVVTGKWNALIALAESKGAKIELGDSKYLAALTRLAPNDLKVSHKADYFSVMQSQALDGSLIATALTLNSEDWQLAADGNWHIDQVMFIVDLHGNIGQAFHGSLVETQDSVVVSDTLNPLEKAEAQAIWGTKLGEWYAYLDASGT